MGHVNLPPSKRHSAGGGGGSGLPHLSFSLRKWKLLDIVSFCFFAGVLVFFLLVFTSLGDSLAASGRRTLALSSDPRQRERILAIFDDAGDGHKGRQLSRGGKKGGGDGAVAIDACSAEEVDHMPCEDPRRNSHLSRHMNFYRERHCPAPEETRLCLIPPPDGYRVPVPWPDSLHKNKLAVFLTQLNSPRVYEGMSGCFFKIWHSNMPHNKIAERKGHQGWMKKEGEFFIFPGGGTMFPEGAVKYIEKLGQYIPISGGVLRTALDMGCGVASFGGYMLKEDILTLSFAPRDSHKSQIQFALERGIPAFVGMLGTLRLPFPAYSFDLLHCSRCLIPFTSYNGTYFAEVDRLLRPGGYLVISGPPVQWHDQDKEWADLQSLARYLCYELIVVDENTAIWKKPSADSCFLNQNEFGLDQCSESDDPSEAWYFNLKNCVSKLSVAGEMSVGSIPNWPDRHMKPPVRVSLLKNGLDVFQADARRWARRVSYYKNTLNLKLGTGAVRNVMDMNAFFGGFAAALSADPVWVMNVVPARKPLTLGVIYDRGFIGVYHDWCEPFSTYPRTYDFIHATGINSLIKDDSGKNRCNLVDLMVEIDRILRPEGTALIRDAPEVINKVGRVARAIRWMVEIHDAEPDSNSNEKILVATKQLWKLPSASS